MCFSLTDYNFRDIASLNVMMDGAPLYPAGHHPVRRNYSVDAIYEVKPLHRIDHPVRYYYIDFCLSGRFPECAPPLVVGDVGRDASVPELSSTVPYDGYKADIHALGTLFEQEFEQVRAIISCLCAFSIIVIELHSSHVEVPRT